MATRTSIRPRPLDVNKQLVIVRDLTELDAWELGLPKELQDPVSADASQAAASQAPAPPPDALPPVPGFGGGPGAAAPSAPAAQAKKPKPKEIPVPEVKEVPTYTRDYLPTFKVPDTYIHGKGGTNFATHDFVEYDLDNEDEDWLDAFNGGGDSRLSDVKFERMLWRLELAWAEAVESAGGPSDRLVPAIHATSGALPKGTALNVLRKAVGGRDVILEQVYEYWAGKRKRWAKPLLRRLQPPTNPNDTNPYNVFRPREKPNRPLTRRRRENSAECLEKLRQIRENLLRALQLAELVILRERKKSDVHHTDITLQRLQLNLAHQAPAAHGALEVQAAAGLRELAARSAVADGRISAYMDIQAGLPATQLDASVQRALQRKRRKLDEDLLASLALTSAEPLSRLPPPVPPPELEPLWAFAPSLLDLPPAPVVHKAPQPEHPPLALPPGLEAALAAGAARAYVGRGGRVVVARCDPFTGNPLRPDSEGMLQPQPSLQATSAPSGALPSPAAAAVGGGAAAVLPDGVVWAFHTPQPQPWALALDLALLPEHVDRAPLLAARQQWVALQEVLGCEVSPETPGRHRSRFPPWGGLIPSTDGSGAAQAGPGGGPGPRVSAPGVGGAGHMLNGPPSTQQRIGGVKGGGTAGRAALGRPSKVQSIKGTGDAMME